MAEVFSWPEAAIYLFPNGGPSAILAYGQDVRGNITYDWTHRQAMATGTFAARSIDHFADKNVTLSVGLLFSDQSAFFKSHSGTAYNARVVFRATGGYTASAEYQIWSAVFTHWALDGQDNDEWRSRVELMAADMSGI